jgi:hypothetical protein
VAILVCEGGKGKKKIFTLESLPKPTDRKQVMGCRERQFIPNSQRYKPRSFNSFRRLRDLLMEKT